MKCQSCPRYRICAGSVAKDVQEFDLEGLRHLFFHEIQMTSGVLSFV